MSLISISNTLHSLKSPPEKLKPLRAGIRDVITSDFAKLATGEHPDPACAQNRSTCSKGPLLMTHSVQRTRQRDDECQQGSEDS